MSAGSFNLSKYSLDDGATIVPISVQPETEALTDGTTANAAPSGAVTLTLRARARKGNSEYGIGARNISISWDGTPPDGYSASGNLTIPILQKSTFDSYSVGDTVTYVGASATIVGKKPESLR